MTDGRRQRLFVAAEATPKRTLARRTPSEWANRLFRPDGNCSCDGGRDFLNRPLIFSAGNHREAVRLCVTPSCAKALRVKPPCPGGLVAGLLKRFSGHLSIRRKDHFEFSAGRRCGREGLACKECCLDVARRHGLCG